MRPARQQAVLLFLLVFATASCSTFSGGTPDPKNFEREYWTARDAWASVEDGWNIMLERDNARVTNGATPWFSQKVRDRALQVVTQAYMIFDRIEPYVRNDDPASQATVRAGLEEIKQLGSELDDLTQGGVQS